MKQYIYCIASDPTGPVKIGRSNDPARRLRQLQTGHAGFLTLYCAEEIPADEVNQMERAIHRVIGHRRISGEWFDLTAEDAVWEIRHAIILNSDNLREVSAADRLGEFEGISTGSLFLVDETEKPN